MNILCIGDFHGKCPALSSVIKKHNVELILSSGDVPDTSILRKSEFKYWKLLHMGFSLEELMGKKRYENAVLNTLKSQKTVFKRLNSYNIPIIMVWGNSDVSKFDYEKNYKYKRYFIQNQIKKYKNIKLIETGTKKIGNLQILAHSGYRYPDEKGIEQRKSYGDKNILQMNKNWDLKLKKLFSKMSKDKKKNTKLNKITIFLAHEPPFGNKLDLVRYKKSPLYGKHIGDEYFLKYVKKNHPNFMVCGHMHENQGLIKIGTKGKQTIVIDCGSAHEKEFAIIDTNQKKVHFF